VGKFDCFTPKTGVLRGIPAQLNTLPLIKHEKESQIFNFIVKL
jgi:hypothetical protein